MNPLPISDHLPDFLLDADPFFLLNKCLQNQHWIKISVILPRITSKQASNLKGKLDIDFIFIVIILYFATLQPDSILQKFVRIGPERRKKPEAHTKWAFPTKLQKINLILT